MKADLIAVDIDTERSPPSRGRGLKAFVCLNYGNEGSRPPRGGVD